MLALFRALVKIQTRRHEVWNAEATGEDAIAQRLEVVTVERQCTADENV